MSKDLEYFKDFLENHASYKVKEFYETLREWAEYVRTHKGDFNYIEDEEWREIRESINDAFQKKEIMKAEFEELTFKLDSMEKSGDDPNKITVYTEWVEFMKRNQVEYAFSDEAIALMELLLNTFIVSAHDCEVAEEEAKKSKIRYEKSLEDLDDTLFEHYERTGKRPVLTALKVKKDN